MPFNFPPSIPSASSAASSQPVVGASAYVYTNNTGYSQLLLVSGGTVTLIEHSRNGTDYFAIGTLIGGEFILTPGEKLRITYAVVPTVTVFPL